MVRIVDINGVDKQVVPIGSEPVRFRLVLDPTEVVVPSGLGEVTSAEQPYTFQLDAGYSVKRIEVQADARTGRWEVV